CSRPYPARKEDIMPSIRRSLFLAGLIGLLALSTSVIGANRDTSAAALRGLPSDVAAVVGRQIECRYWSNQEIADAADDAAVTTALVRLKCDKLDADEAALRVKYTRRPEMLKVLDAAHADAL
ncbi:MAG: hypothetical protein ACHQK9_22505, partial [Reyranellales bacterium]